jgi:transcriptional regulator with XRE-family HTH domain
MQDHVGRRIAEVRKAQDLTQAKLGAQLGWSGQVVSFIERGSRQLDVEELLTVSRALGVAVISLLLPFKDETVRVVLPSGEELDADGIRDAVMGRGAAEQHRKVAEAAEAARREAEELHMDRLWDFLEGGSR